MSDVPGRLLRETLQSRMSNEPGTCLDPETLAAWADGTLSPAERRAAEGHAAACARCQSMLAAMARTAPPAVSRVWWRSPLGWIVPLTAAAAALLVWIELPRQARLPAPPSAAAQLNTAREVKAESSSAALAAAPIAASPRREARAARPDAKPGRDANKDVAPPVTANAAKEAVGGSLAKLSSEAAPAAAPTEQLLAPTLQEAAAAPAARPRNLLVDARRQASGIAIPSPDASSRWRITAAGVVQHSTDGGSTWDTQVTGAPVVPTAGMSPSPSVCWLVGPRGLVLLSTDGRSWRRIAFPEMADLIAVRAADEKTATVTTSDGRSLTTRDGGATWGQ